jgi:integrase
LATTFESSVIAGGVNAKDPERVARAGVDPVTIDRYWHLSPGDESEAAGLLDAYLERVSPTGAIVRVGND